MSKNFTISEDAIIRKAYESIAEIIAEQTEKSEKEGFSFISMSWEAENNIHKIVKDCEMVRAIIRECAELEPQR